MKLTLEQIEKGTGGILLFGHKSATVTGVSIDSRTWSAGNLFVAIAGERVDGHSFVPLAGEEGLGAALVSDTSFLKENLGDNQVLQEKLKTGTFGVIQVEDTVKALQALSRYYLSLLNIKLIGVTGSTGKTTTKDMIYYVCSRKYKVGRTTGNKNNHIGLPLTILSFDEDTEVGVLEMGMDRPGEIEFLVELTRPHIGVITNIGDSHIEHLKTRENILKAKMEITKYLKKEDVLIVNTGCDLLSGDIVKGNYRLATVGTTGKSDFILSDFEALGDEGVAFTIEHKEVAQQFKLPVPGRHNGINAALAVAAGVELGISPEEAALGLSEMVMTEKRLTIKGKGGIKVIDDTYNASPDSVRAAIDVLMTVKGIRRVAILGDMFELGEGAETFHGDVGRYGIEAGADLLVAVGSLSKATAKAAKAALATRPEENSSEERVFYFETKAACLKALPGLIQRGDVVLVKGSRGMEMEEIVKVILDSAE